MIWLATFLVAAGVGDLVRPSRQASAVTAALLAGTGGALLAGARDPLTLLGAVAFAGLGALWTSRRDDGPEGRAVVSLSVLAAGVGAGLALAAVPHPGGGLLGRWWVHTHPAARSHRPDVSVWLLLHLGLVLVQFATGNRIVRQVLSVSTTEAPPGTSPLRGGRLLGPMERVIILGLGMVGQPTAASVVIAAKGLLRFPELQHSRLRRPKSETWGIHQVTEYFLVGSFVSWSVALGALALATLG